MFNNAVDVLLGSQRFGLVHSRITVDGLGSFDAIEYLGKDELLEVTPLAYRIRKQILSAHDRGKLNKSAIKAALEAEG